MSAINEIPIYISHERIFDGEAIQLYASQFQREVGKENIYVPEFSTDYRAGPSTIGADMLETEIKINIDASFPRNAGDALPNAGDAGSVLSVDDSTDTITITDHPVSFPEAGEWVPIGAVDIDTGTVVVETTDGATQFTEGTDYEVRYPEGELRILSAGSMSAETDYHYSLSFNYTKRNMGRICQDMSTFGGAIVVGVDDADASTSYGEIGSESEAMFTYTMFVNDSSYSWDASNPEESRLSMSLREARDVIN